MKISPPIFIGYFPKKIVPRDTWLKDKSVVDICSVSNCISPAPEGWMEQWKHNNWWIYDSEELAMSIVPTEDQPKFEVLAYSLFPHMFDGKKIKNIEVVTTAKVDLSHYDSIGYDIVNGDIHSNFGCSPLSCNNGNDTFKVNQHCLIDDLVYAWKVSRQISDESKEKKRWEPGPYFLLEVYRKTRMEKNEVDALSPHGRNEID